MTNYLSQYQRRLQNVLAKVLELSSHFEDVLESALWVLVQELDDDVDHVV